MKINIFYFFVILVVSQLFVSCQDETLPTPTRTTTTIPTTQTNVFVGKFKGKLTGLITIDPMLVEITATTKANEVSVKLDLGAMGVVPGIAAATNNNDITIAKQTVNASEYSGAGKLTDKTLTFTLSQKNAVGTQQFVFTGTKQ